MPITPIVKVFIASSITELENERILISDAISQDLTRLLEQDNIIIQFLRSDSIHEGNDGRPDQEKNDDMLHRCNVSLFLFKDKEGDYTIHDNDIGFVYANMNNYPKALELYKKALIIKQNKLGDDYPDTVATKQILDSVISTMTFKR